MELFQEFQLMKRVDVNLYRNNFIITKFRNKIMIDKQGNVVKCLFAEVSNQSLT